MTILGFAIGYSLGLIIILVLYNLFLAKERKETDKYMKQAICNYCDKKGGKYLDIKEVIKNV
jgi:hypothetical protein